MKLILGSVEYCMYLLFNSLSNEGNSSMLSKFLPKLSYSFKIRCLIAGLEQDSIARSNLLSTSLSTAFLNKSASLYPARTSRTLRILVYISMSDGVYSPNVIRNRRTV